MWKDHHYYGYIINRTFHGYWSEVVWNFIGVYIIMHYMVAWRYEISLLVLKNISLVHCTHSWDIIHNSKRNFISPHRHVISSFYTTYTTVINSYSVKKKMLKVLCTGSPEVNGKGVQRSIIADQEFVNSTLKKGGILTYAILNPFHKMLH